jgi:hypothetical protein
MSEKRTVEWARQVSKELWKSGTEAEDKLRAKCNWEHMTRLAVILEWGDPRTWT